MVRLGRVARGPRLPWPFNGAVWLSVGLIVLILSRGTIGGVLVGVGIAWFGVFVLAGYRVSVRRFDREMERYR